MLLADQVVVVVGASSGIGRAAALSATAQGADVLAVARDEAALATLRRDTTTLPGRLAVVTAEVSDPTSMRAVAAEAVARFGRIDTWAHVAGVSEYSRTEDHTDEEFARVVNVTLMGVVHGARAALPYLRESGGALVVVSSVIAVRAFPLASAYSAAKHGVHGFLTALRLELHQERAGVRVVEVQPGPVATPFFEHARTRLGVRPSGPPPVYAPERVAEAILRAAQRGDSTVVVGAVTKVMTVSQRLTPRAMDMVARVAGYRFQQSRDRKAVGDGDALQAPVDGDDRINGVLGTWHR